MGNVKKQEIIIIVAYLAETRGIGYQGKLPWENTPIKADMEQFKKETLGHTVVMGRETWLSLPEKYRPLPGRQNIIVSKTLDPATLPNNVKLVCSIDEAISIADRPKIFMIGGVGIYKEVMEKNIAHKIMATIVHDNFLEYDRVFPEITSNWKNIYQSSPGIDQKSDLKIQFCTLINQSLIVYRDSGGATSEGG